MIVQQKENKILNLKKTASSPNSENTLTSFTTTFLSASLNCVIRCVEAASTPSPTGLEAAVLLAVAFLVSFQLLRSSHGGAGWYMTHWSGLCAQ